MKTSNTTQSRTQQLGKAENARKQRCTIPPTNCMYYNNGAVDNGSNVNTGHNTEKNTGSSYFHGTENIIRNVISGLYKPIELYTIDKYN